MIEMQVRAFIHWISLQHRTGQAGSETLVHHPDCSVLACVSSTLQGLSLQPVGKLDEKETAKCFEKWSTCSYVNSEAKTCFFCM